MVVRLRLQRFGRKHLPFYRIVVADSRSPRDGKFIERVSITLQHRSDDSFLLLLLVAFPLIYQIGTYNPIPTKDGVKELAVNSERVHHWMTCGAQPSDRVKWLLGQIGILPQAPVRNTTKFNIPKEILRAQK